MITQLHSRGSTSHVFTALSSFLGTVLSQQEDIYKIKLDNGKEYLYSRYEIEISEDRWQSVARCFSFYSDKARQSDTIPVWTVEAEPQLRRSCVGHDVVRQDTTRATMYIFTTARQQRTQDDEPR